MLDPQTRADMAQALRDSYRPREVEGASCFMCGQGEGPFSMHVAELSLDEEATFPDHFVAMSARPGVIRGSFPLCVSCARPCRKCGLPILKRDTVQFVNEMKRKLDPDDVILFEFGNGYCRHMHILGFVL